MQLPLKVSITQDHKPNRKIPFFNAQYGHHEEFSAWVDEQLARPALKDSMGMFARDLLTLVKLTGLPRTIVTEGWGLNQGSLSHFLKRWDNPMTAQRQNEWLKGAHLLDLPPRDARRKLLATVRKRHGIKGVLPLNGQADPRPRPTAIKQHKPAPWLYVGIGLALGAALAVAALVAAS